MSNRRNIIFLLIIVLFNIIDAAATLFWLDLGIAYETNPLMYQALIYHPIVFILSKLILVNAGVFILFRYRTRYLAKLAIWAAVLFYSTVIITHARMAFMLYL